MLIIINVYFITNIVINIAYMASIMINIISISKVKLIKIIIKDNLIILLWDIN